jgi:hypothetical protein
MLAFFTRTGCAGLCVCHSTWQLLAEFPTIRDPPQARFSLLRGSHLKVSLAQWNKFLLELYFLIPSSPWG